MTLTAEQLSVVNLASGRHLVLAPPGSGKTEMLSQRIIRALASGADTKKMLCATFTNRAAFEMRDRVSGAAGPDRALPDVGNLHHFCHRFLLSVRRIRLGKHVLDESQQLDFIREVTDVLREELRGGAADLKKTHGVSVMPMIKGICEPMRIALSEILEEYFADCEEDDRSPYPDILSSVLIAHQWKLGIPSCCLRQVPSQMRELIDRGMFAAGWDPRRLFAARDPVPSVPHVWDRSRRWAWRNRRVLSSLRKRLKPAYDAIVPRLGRRADFRFVLTAFSKVSLENPMRYSIRELVSEKKAMEADLHRELTESEAREYALRRVELFFRYVDHVYGKDARSFEQALAEDWQKLSKLKEADLLVGDEKIVISTVHKAKGRQFDAVIVPGADEMTRGGKGADREEALRLLYVAMSRAKRHLTLMDCGPGGVWQNLAECFRADHSGYYLRRSRGDDLSHDWLHQWEELAKANGEGRCPMELVEPALASKAGAVVRMALKTLRHHPDPAESRRRWLDCIESDFAETAICCLRVARVYDSETICRIRKAAIASEKERDHRAALEYFKAGMATAPVQHAELWMSVGDFIYHRCGTLRLDAAAFLAKRGVTRWSGIIQGASTDFVRLESATDAEHEETIRAILAKKDLPDEYERRLRMILFARAKRITST